VLQQRVAQLASACGKVQQVQCRALQQQQQQQQQVVLAGSSRQRLLIQRCSGSGSG
jgi:hypothetical protein